MAFRRLHQAYKHLRFPAKSAPRPSRHARPGRHAVAAAVDAGRHYGVESLEDRTLFTTLHGGDTFLYRQNADVYRVKLRGNITAELIGAQVNGETNALSLVN